MRIFICGKNDMNNFDSALTYYFGGYPDSVESRIINDLQQKWEKRKKLVYSFSNFWLLFEIFKTTFMFIYLTQK